MVSDRPRNGNVSAVRWTLGVIGIAFTALGVWGFIDPTLLGVAALTAAHNVLFVVTGFVLVAAGFASVSASAVAWVARVVGVLYAFLGAVGFFAPGLFAPALTLTAGENTLHLLAGVLIAILGFMVPRRREAAARARRPAV